MDEGAATALFSVLFSVFAFLIFVGYSTIWTMNNNARSKRDSAAAVALNNGLTPLLSRLSAGVSISPESKPARTGLRIGEVSRHFDSNTSATITGWLTHNLGFHGWGLGVEIGALGLGLGMLGLAGTSQVNLTSSGTTRDNLMSDGFVAVLEQDTPTGPDTVRLVVPSEQAARELVSALLDEVAEDFTKTDGNGETSVEYPPAYSALERLGQRLLAFPDEASYVSDRLHSVMRMPEGSRPSIAIWGSSLSQHAILGSAIRIGDDGPIQPLFPLDLITAIRKVTERAIATAKGYEPSPEQATGLLPPMSGEDADRIDVDPMTGTERWWREEPDPGFSAEPQPRDPSPAPSQGTAPDVEPCPGVAKVASH
jgi:hypothetical protein